MKRILAFILMLLVVTLSVIPAFSKTVFADGDWCYEAVPSGSLWRIDSYLGSDATVTVPSKYGSYDVVAIGKHAFVNNASVQTVIAEAPAAEIDEYAFFCCTALTTVVLSSSLETLGVAAFANDVLLTDINLGDTSVTAIPAYCFSGCTALEAIALPETCTSIGNCAFQNCSALTSVTIPASVTEIHMYAFIGCDNLVIHAPYGSYAIEYAVAHEIPYEYSDLTKVTFKRGDADGDGSINIMDATKIQRVLAKYEEDNDGMIALRSRLGDEDFGIMDATRIQRFLARYTDPYRISEEETVFLMPDGTIFSSAA